ncbi:hypothetical protein [Spiroplasma gladiatoris]|nr:hypothetical protein [Spiroplasma gladiatoris]
MKIYKGLSLLVTFLCLYFSIYLISPLFGETHSLVNFFNYLYGIGKNSLLLPIINFSTKSLFTISIALIFTLIIMIWLLVVYNIYSIKIKFKIKNKSTLILKIVYTSIIFIVSILIFWFLIEILKVFASFSSSIGFDVKYLLNEEINKTSSNQNISDFVKFNMNINFYKYLNDLTLVFYLSVFFVILVFTIEMIKFKKVMLFKKLKNNNYYDYFNFYKKPKDSLNYSTYSEKDYFEYFEWIKQDLNSEFLIKGNSTKLYKQHYIKEDIDYLMKNQEFFTDHYYFKNSYFSFALKPFIIQKDELRNMFSQYTTKHNEVVLLLSAFYKFARICSLSLSKNLEKIEKFIHFNLFEDNLLSNRLQNDAKLFISIALNNIIETFKDFLEEDEKDLDSYVDLIECNQSTAYSYQAKLEELFDEIIVLDMNNYSKNDKTTNKNVNRNYDGDLDELEVALKYFNLTKYSNYEDYKKSYRLLARKFHPDNLNKKKDNQMLIVNKYKLILDKYFKGDE